MFQHHRESVNLKISEMLTMFRHSIVTIHSIKESKDTVKKIRIIRIKNIKIKNIRIRNIRNSRTEILKKTHNILCFTHLHHRQCHSTISILLFAIIVKKRDISSDNALNLKHSRKLEIDCFEKKKLKSVRQFNQHNSSKNLVRQKSS